MFTPQQILDQLNEIGLPKLFSDDISPKERAIDIKLAKQRLKQVKQRLKQEEDFIQKSRDGRNQNQRLLKQIEIAPYLALNDIISQVDTAVTELETSISLNRFSSRTLDIGKVIVGDRFVGDWRILSAEEGLKYAQSKLTETRKRKLSSKYYIYIPLFMWGPVVFIFGTILASMFASPIKGNEAALQVVLIFGGLMLIAIWIGLSQYGRRKKRQRLIDQELSILQHEVEKMEQLCQREITQKKSVLTQPAQPFSIELPEESGIDSRTQIQKAVTLIHAGARKEAEQIILNVLKADPQYADAWYLAGFLNSDRNKKIMAYQKALTLNSQHIKAKDALAKL